MVRALSKTIFTVLLPMYIGSSILKTVTNARLDTMYAQGPLGPSDATFVPNKADAAATVNTQ